MNWKIVENRSQYPKQGEYILFIGKSGKVGCGLVKSYFVEMGGGASQLYDLDKIYAYTYPDLPYDLIRDMYKNLIPRDKGVFKRSILGTFMDDNGML